MEDTTGRLLGELRSRNKDTRLRAASKLRQYVKSQSREMTDEAFTKFMTDLNRRAFELVNSPENHVKLGGILAINELIDVPVKENETKIIRFANYLRGVFPSPTADYDTLRLASKALGHLARAGGTMTADFVEFEVTRALEWLQGEQRFESRRLAAVLILRELADNAPTLFYQHVSLFCSHIWVALTDPKETIRDNAAKALASCLALVAHRKSRYRAQWYSNIYRLAWATFTAPRSTPEAVHGALLTVGELLINSGDFMIPKFAEACTFVLKHRESRHRLVRRTVIALLSRLAGFQPETFVVSHADTVLTHLLSSLRNVSERATAFVALGRVSVAMGTELCPDALRPKLDEIMILLKDGLTPRRGRPFCPEALYCISMLATAVGAPLVGHMHDLLDPMFSDGLSRTLIDALKLVAGYIPALLRLLQERLLHELSLILAGTPFIEPGSTSTRYSSTTPSTAGTTKPSGTTTSGAGAGAGAGAGSGSGASDSRLLRLALHTLGTFNFSGIQLLPFARDCVVKYLGDDDVGVRKEAALTCAHLLDPFPSLTPLVPDKFAVDTATSTMALTTDRPLLGVGPSVRMIGDVLEQLLMVGIADLDAGIRQEVLNSLDSRFDPYLCQSENLRLLFIALHDESFRVREVAIGVIGRLTHRNPAYVLPGLRKTLIQLLTELEYSAHFHAREQAAKLLGQLIRAAHRLVSPYAAPILKALLPKLHDSHPGVASAVLSTLGALSVVGRDQTKEHLGELLPFVIDTLQDQSSGSKQEVAVRTLGLLVENTGYVITPYIDHPGLISILLGILNRGVGASWGLRKEVLRTMGILGAIDPYLLNQAHVQRAHAAITGRTGAGAGAGGVDPDTGAGNDEADDSGFAGDGDPSAAPAWQGVDVSNILPSMVSAAEDYHPTVAITALMRLLSDPALSIHHNMVLQAVMWIFQSLRGRCVPFLPQVVPPFLTLLNHRDTSLRESLLQQLAVLVKHVRQHIRPYLPAVFRTIKEVWPACISPLLRLIETISEVLGEEFKTYLPDLVPLMASMFSVAAEPHRGASGAGVSATSSPMRSSSLSGAGAGAGSASSSDALLASNPAVRQVLHTLVALGPLLVNLLYLIIPGLVRMIGLESMPIAGQRHAIDALGCLARDVHLAEYGSRIILPLTRLLHDQDPVRAPLELKIAALDTICFLAKQLRDNFVAFIPEINKALKRQQISHPVFEHVMKCVQTDPASLLDDSVPMPGGGGLLGGLARDVSSTGASWSTAEAGHDTAAKQLSVNQEKLKRAWEVSQRSTKEDWTEWMTQFSVELLRESPSPALRSCCSVAQVHHPIARELFNAAFVSCWSKLRPSYQEHLVTSLETAFVSTTIPPDILTALLNLAEFMEHDEQPLPIDIRVLGSLAKKCHAYAKALHYKELEFHTNKAACLEDLIAINNQLEQPEAAVGILKYAQKHKLQLHSGVGATGTAVSAPPAASGPAGPTSTAGRASDPMDGVFIDESWFEKLGRWEDALEAYERKHAENPTDTSLTLGRMRCLKSLGEWQKLHTLAAETWDTLGDITVKRQVAPIAARAAWALGNWEAMSRYVGLTDENQLRGAFFRALLAIHRDKFETAHKYIDKARKFVAAELSALVGETYNRAYRKVVVVQQLSEMEEVVHYMRLCQSSSRETAHSYVTHLRKLWAQRLQGCQRNVDVWQRILSVRTLVGFSSEDLDSWLKFASLCRHNGRMNISRKVLFGLGVDPTWFATPTTGDAPSWPSSLHPRVVYMYLKHMWWDGQKSLALSNLQSLTRSVDHQIASFDAGGPARRDISIALRDPVTGAVASSTFTEQGRESLVSLQVRCHLRLGQWQQVTAEEALSAARSTPVTDYASLVEPVLDSFRTATHSGPTHYRAWHAWAIMNYNAAEFYQKVDHKTPEVKKALAAHVVPAVNGFFRSISLGRTRLKAHVQQDLLRLLTLWFTHGSPDVINAIEAGLGSISINTWLQVIPQLIARIHTRTPAIKLLLHQLLSRVGDSHPQALVYPLTVSSKSATVPRRLAAVDLLSKLRRRRSTLVDQAELVSKELIRVAVLWHEMWHAVVEEASRLYFGNHNEEAMINTLIPLHEMMQAGATTMQEVSFQQMYGAQLEEAYTWLLRARKSGEKGDLDKAWDIYYVIFRRINKQLLQVQQLELQYVSPALLAAKDLELAVPGTYHADREEVHIRSFVPQLQVIMSKQRPRKITLFGSDGRRYSFLLKGNEDLRQDERVTQLFGLANSLLKNDPQTSKRDLTIRRYSVTPLSHEAGVVGWVESCDTLNALIRDYRESRNVLVNIEHRLMCQMAPMYDHLTPLQKVEVFQHALDSTTGTDLAKILWFKSRSSEVWLSRRSAFTRSLASMSVVGYILGLGDRHPSNLMLHRLTGKILHIDFGDCFEVAITRDKFPERVPFRLTRMLTNAMEVAGIEGTFRAGMDSVMRVLRSNRESVMAMLEAFVHDPLINWRLLNPAETTSGAGSTSGGPSGGEAGALGAGAGAGAGAVGGTAAASLLGESKTAEPTAPVPFSVHDTSDRHLTHANRGEREREMVAALGPEGSSVPTEALNQRAVAVLDRINAKLTGRDFGDDSRLGVEEQVQRLISEATSVENLSVSYIGWCPFW